MKVIYEKTLVEKVIEINSKALENNKIIDYIELNKEEAKELYQFNIENAHFLQLANNCVKIGYSDNYIDKAVLSFDDFLQDIKLPDEIPEKDMRNINVTLCGIELFYNPDL